MTKETALTYASVLAEADKAQSVIEGKRETVAQHLLQLASTCSTPEQFEAGCASAEQNRKQRLTEIAADKGLSKAERKRMTRLPAAWSNAKSIILRGWEDYGLIPNDFETFSQFKDSKTKMVKDSKDTARKLSGGKVESSSIIEGDITSVLFGEVMGRIRKLPGDVQEEIALHLEELVSKYEPSQEVQDDDSVSDQEALEAAQQAAVNQ